jgi:hypothetical protein
MVRLMHTSAVRRATRAGETSLSLIDLDGSEWCLRAPSVLARVEARAELAAICRYACTRKESSKAGSILILRFFHGYFPSEVSRIARITPRTVDEFLRLARREARLFCTDPTQIAFLTKTHTMPAIPDARVVDDPVRFVQVLREAVFASSTTPCDGAQMTAIYESNEQHAIPSDVLAHVVSCRPCLDRVNALVSLPTGRERFPDDTFGPDAGSSGTPGGRASAFKPSALRRGRHLHSIIEHRAEELRVAVNGFIVGSCTVGQAVTRQTVSVQLTEPIGSVEVLGRGDARLLFVMVQPQPHGAIEQTGRIELSQGRTLEATISFAQPWPEIRILYHDPELAGGTVGGEMLAAARLFEPREHRTVARRADDVYRAWWLAPRALVWKLALVGVVAALLFLGPARTFAAVGRVGRAVVQFVQQVFGVKSPSPLPSRSINLGPGPSALPASTQWVAPVGHESDRVAPAPMSDTTLAELEIEALRRLDQVGALTAEQATVQRDGRRIVVRAIVDSGARQAALWQALAGLPRTVTVDVMTFDDAARRQTATGWAGVVRAAELSRERVPVYDDIRAYLVSRPADRDSASPLTDAQLDDAVRRFASQVLSRSLEARLQARTVLELADRVPSARLTDLSAPAVASWSVMIRHHADAFGRESQALRHSLEHVFGSAWADGTASDEPGDQDGDLWRIAARVFELATAHDVAIGRAFAISTDGAGATRVKDGAFAKSLVRAERLAERIRARGRTGSIR